MLVLSVWSWQPDIVLLQFWLQLLISFILLSILFFHLKHPSLSAVVSVDTDGQWLWLASQTSANILPASKISQFILWIYLQEADGKRHCWWIYKDAVSDKNFRRLSRVILQVQKHQVETE